jgi:hypothetical protein
VAEKGTRYSFTPLLAVARWFGKAPCAPPVKVGWVIPGMKITSDLCGSSGLDESGRVWVISEPSVGRQYCWR